MTHFYTVVGGIGLSHSLGYALGSPYGIPHGVTSCLTLGKVVKLKAQDPEAAVQIARILPYIGRTCSMDNQKDALEVGDAIINLVKRLGLETDLKQYGKSCAMLLFSSVSRPVYSLGCLESGLLLEVAGESYLYLIRQR